MTKLTGDLFDASDGSSQSRAVYVISVAAELAGLHPQTLRIYERRGLIEPQRTQGGNRRYSQNDILTMKRIQDLMNEGLNIEGVRKVMELEAQIELLKAEINNMLSYQNEIVKEIHKLYKNEIVPMSWWQKSFINPKAGKNNS
jgi:MerR family transcriptional regulator/heat shock protein HspR